MNEFYDSNGKVILLFFEGLYFRVVDLITFSSNPNPSPSHPPSSVQNICGDMEMIIPRGACGLKPPVPPEQLRLTENLKTLARELFASPKQIDDFCSLAFQFKMMNDRKLQILRNVENQRPDLIDEMRQLSEDQHEMMENLSSKEKSLMRRMLETIESIN